MFQEPQSIQCLKNNFFSLYIIAIKHLIMPKRKFTGRYLPLAMAGAQMAYRAYRTAQGGPGGASCIHRRPARVHNPPARAGCRRWISIRARLHQPVHQQANGGSFSAFYYGRRRKPFRKRTVSILATILVQTQLVQWQLVSVSRRSLWWTQSSMVLVMPFMTWIASMVLLLHCKQDAECLDAKHFIQAHASKPVQ